MTNVQSVIEELDSEKIYQCPSLTGTVSIGTGEHQFEARLITPLKPR